VFVWPEGAVYGDPSKLRAVRSLVRETGAEIWTGSLIHRRRSGRHIENLNSAYRVDSDGRSVGRYDKMLRVPFGEYMPFTEWLPILDRIEGGGDLTAGESPRVFSTHDTRFAFLICYEAIHHRFVRDSIALEPDLLVNLTYDAWFGDTASPHQHMMLSAIGAALFGRPLIRAATTGISAFVDSRGVITSKTQIFEAAALVADVPLIHAPTFYETVGDAFAWCCVALSCIAIVYARFR